jgi:YggT family protein
MAPGGAPAAQRKACPFSLLFGSVTRPCTSPRFGHAMQSLLHLLSAAIGIYIWIILIQVILSWLIAFKVINMSNQFVYMISNTFYRLTEPALQPIRRFMPNLGGVDISPVILILLLYFVQNLLHEYWPR